jgi:calcium-dependent protein kinase
MIPAEVLFEHIKDQNLKISDQAVWDMIRELNYLGNGKINYSEFLAATIDDKLLINEAKLRNAFSIFDCDRDGLISESDL